jgi:putative SOS response-associated peptidase YedK
LAFVNHRMPVILDGSDAEAAWLSEEVDADGALELARPLPDGRLDVHAVGARINSSRNDGLDLLDPVATAA